MGGAVVVIREPEPFFVEVLRSVVGTSRTTPAMLRSADSGRTTDGVAV
jgi:hypothetical protein